MRLRRLCHVSWRMSGEGVMIFHDWIRPNLANPTPYLTNRSPASPRVPLPPSILPGGAVTMAGICVPDSCQESTLNVSNLPISGSQLLCVNSPVKRRSMMALTTSLGTSRERTCIELMHLMLFCCTAASRRARRLAKRRAARLLH
jgi:hypothetical protein